MMRSLFSGVSGLKSHQTRMDVIGNNIANINTVGFKSSRATFADMLSQTTSGAAAPSANRGGTNPKQIGLGVAVASIDLIFTDGSPQSTGKNTDLALSGNGLFVVKNGTQTYYTRDGAFEFDGAGNYVLPGSGYLVQGWNAVDGTLNTTAVPENIVVPAGRTMEASATTQIDYTGNLNASSTIIKNITYTSGTGDEDLVVNTATISKVQFYDATGAAVAAPVDGKIDGVNYSYADVTYTVEGVDTTIRETTGTYKVGNTITESVNVDGTNVIAATLTLSDGSTQKVTSGFYEIGHSIPVTTIINVFDAEGKSHAVTILLDKDPTSYDSDYPNADSTALDNRWRVYLAPEAGQKGAASIYETDEADGSHTVGYLNDDGTFTITNNSGASNAAIDTSGANVEYSRLGTALVEAGFTVNLTTGVVSYTGEGAAPTSVDVSTDYTRQTTQKDTYTVIQQTGGNRLEGTQITTRIVNDMTALGFSGTAGNNSFTFNPNAPLTVDVGSNTYTITVVDASAGTYKLQQDDGSGNLTDVAAADITADVVAAMETAGFPSGAVGTNSFTYSPTAPKSVTISGTEYDIKQSGASYYLQTAEKTTLVSTPYSADLIAALSANELEVYDGETVLHSTDGAPNSTVTLDGVTYTIARSYNLSSTVVATTGAAVTGDLGTTAYNSLATELTAMGFTVNTTASPATISGWAIPTTVTVNGTDYTLTTTDTSNITVADSTGTIAPENYPAALLTRLQELGFGVTGSGASTVISHTGTAPSEVTAGGSLYSITGGGTAYEVFPATKTTTEVSTITNTIKNALENEGFTVIDNTVIWTGSGSAPSTVSYTDASGTTHVYDVTHTVDTYSFTDAEGNTVDLAQNGELLASLKENNYLVSFATDQDGNTTSYVTYYENGNVAPPADTTVSTSISYDLRRGGLSFVYFNDDGSYDGNTTSGGSIFLQYSNGNGAADTTSSVMFTGLTQYSGSSTAYPTADGNVAGVLQSVSVDTSGIITGTYTNGERRFEAQVAVAQFTNASGLTKVGNSLYQESNNSGTANVRTVDDLGLTITPSALEMSNVDLASEFADMIVTQRGFQSNSKIITVGDEMLETVINMKR